MLLSLTRAIAIKLPFVRVSKAAVMGSVGVYVLAVVTETVLGKYTDIGEVSIYDSQAVYCLDEVAKQPWQTILEAFYTISIGVPPLVVLFSFGVSIHQLRRGLLSGSVNQNAASLTILLFTAMFLVLTIPFFITNLLLLGEMSPNYVYPGPIFQSDFMSNYMWLLSSLVLFGINSAVNPVLYFTRIPRFRAWICRREVVRVQTWTCRREVVRVRQETIAMSEVDATTH